MLYRKVNYSSLGLAYWIVLFVLLPVWFLGWRLGFSVRELFIVMVHFSGSALFILSLFSILSGLNHSLFRTLFSIVGGFLFLFMVILWAYSVWSNGSRFDIMVLWDSFNLVWPTLKKTTGMAFLPIIVGLVFLFALAFYVSWITFRIVHLNTKNSLIVLCISAVSIWMTPNVYGSVWYASKLVSRNIHLRTLFQPKILSLPAVDNVTHENVLVVQLESVNGLYSYLQYENQNAEMTSLHLPEMERIAQDGYFVPHMVSTSVQTNRALASILCGVSGNIGQALSYRDDVEWANLCLPKYLSEKGFNTIFLSNYEDGEFMNLQVFLEKVGFDEVRYGDMMQPGDTWYEWGADDCTFYDRVVPLLKEKSESGNPYLAMLEVSAHHFPYDSRGYDEVHVYQNPENNTRKYLNSLREQDYCLGYLYDLLLKESFENTHLIILSDTSWPVGLHGPAFFSSGAYNDDVLVPFVYVPPIGSDENVGKVFDKRYVSQSGIRSTILELLSGESVAQSFGYLFTGREDTKDDCAVFAQPYGGSQWGIYKNGKKYLYTAVDESILVFDLESDILEQNKLEKIDGVVPVDFLATYYCY